MERETKTHITSIDTGIPHIDRPHTFIETEWIEAMEVSCASKEALNFTPIFITEFDFVEPKA